MAAFNFIIRDNLQDQYKDVYTPEVLQVLSELSHFNGLVKETMQ